MKILFLAAEAEPFIKVGGLGDVAGSLPRALRSLKPSFSMNGQEPDEVDVRLVIPFHQAIQRSQYTLETVATFAIQHTGGPIRAEILMTNVNDVPVYLVSGAPFLAEDSIYSPDATLDGYKYTFFSLAALELARALDWAPDIVHANDWHTAPAIYTLRIRPDAFFQNTATLIEVHNLPYLGVGAGPALQSFGLPPALHTALPIWAQDLPLPLGLLAADHIVTVSPTYAKEILTPEYASGLEGFLQTRADSISGILNGLNVEKWDPALDSALAAQYNQDNLKARALNKESLQNELELTSFSQEVPLLGMVSRLDPQKGIDLVPGTLRLIDDIPWKAVILGTGTPELEADLDRLKERYPNRVQVVTLFDPLLSRRIYAGADILLIPSRYEPCGLTQMIAMRYGCVPVARATGGLIDTIQDFDFSEHGTGFLFKQPTIEAFSGALRRALEVFQKPGAWRRLQQDGMAQDFSWERSARQYLKLYQFLVRKKNLAIG